MCPACTMDSEAEFYTIDWMIKGYHMRYHIHRDVWLSYILEKWCSGRGSDEKSAEGPFGSATAVKQNWNVYSSLEILVELN